MNPYLYMIVGLCLIPYSFFLSAAEQPNIIYILADDMGYGDVAANNPNCKFPTPFLDQLAEGGMRFSDAHTNSSVCTPTRYGILTGRYSWRTRLKGGVLDGAAGPLIASDRTTVATFLKKQGYNTACVGKWHLGMSWPTKDGKKPVRSRGDNIDFTQPIENGPNDVGFDYFYGISASLNMPPHAYIKNRMIDGKDLVFAKDSKDIKALGLVRAKEGWVSKSFKQDRVLRTFAEKSVAWIKKQKKGKPFFLYIPLNSPHSPIVPQAKFKDKSGINPHADFCMETDWAVGEIMKAVDEMEFSKNTLFVFTADNGTSPAAKYEHLQAAGQYPSHIYRGLKGSLWEGGHRVPFIVRWPKVVKAGSVNDQLICVTDLLATVSEITQVDLAPDEGEDSVSFLASLTNGEENDSVRGGVVHHSDSGIFSIRKGKWKLIFDGRGGTRRENPKDRAYRQTAPIQLYDMDEDSVESTNLQEEYPEVVNQLKRLLADFVNRGRSTDGEAQKNDPFDKDWKELWPVREYLNEALRGQVNKKQ